MKVPGRKGIENDGGGLMGPGWASRSMRGKTVPAGGRPKPVRAVFALAVVIAVLAAAGLAVPRLVDLRYVNIPLFHPYPPAGMQQNPLNPSDRADLVRSTEAAQVEADLLADGKIEIQAASTGNVSILEQADTGRALTSLRGLLQTDAQQGVFEKNVNHLDSSLVGHLRDPNDSAIDWCVVERGESTLTYVNRESGAVVTTRTFPFVGRFWMVKQGSRYLIADTQITDR